MEKAPTRDFSQYRRFYQQLKPLWNKPKKRASTAAVFSLLATALFGWFAIKPTVQTILYLRREIKDKTEVNKQMEEKITHLIEAQAAYETVSGSLPVLDQADPSTPEAVDVVRQLRNLAGAAGASISAIQLQSVPIAATATPSGKATGESVAELTINAVLSGTYIVIRSFLDGILSMRRVLTMEVVNLNHETSIAQTMGDNLLKITLKFKAYYTGGN
ncbi:type 4a pilus biogenesis protein PilO [Patescibacteria group bacterium]|nr:type 4a pilus biogenesis protein PilO [Patescibacteria group bacterium]MBU1473119.1 type 4a pilus biogenesis protein PilO [Patescibacteria group bacterium]MBU2459655.1 type 4a pilus biogenesis protein PilO [Patescibacteria group bacterium]MBU2544442.1 type 4a pilus biogenesis protein PilO [Patescibacteria group bacterium]